MFSPPSPIAQRTCWQQSDRKQQQQQLRCTQTQREHRHRQTNKHTKRNKHTHTPSQTAKASSCFAWGSIVLRVKRCFSFFPEFPYCGPDCAAAPSESEFVKLYCVKLCCIFCCILQVSWRVHAHACANDDRLQVNWRLPLFLVSWWVLSLCPLGAWPWRLSVFY